MKKAIYIGAFILLFGSLSLSVSLSIPLAHAQTIGTTSLDGIDIQSSPASPTPGQSITVSITSYSANLDTAAITWAVDGKKYSTGVGKTSINITAPALGKTTQVVVDIQTSTGADIEKTLSISSGIVDIVWESSGYNPPFYQGKVPFVFQNTATFTAIPQLLDRSGKLIDPANLIYQWKENTFALGSQSGYGKQSVQVTSSIVSGPIRMLVDVTSPDGFAHGEAQFTLQPVAPSIVFYQDDPLYGVLYNSAINTTLRLIHNQTKVVAAPYGFDISAPGLAYTWSINGTAQSSLTGRSAVLGANGGDKGSSNVDLSMQNSGNDILQSAEASFTATLASPATSASSSVF